MHMGTAQVPTLSELEAEIERRELVNPYAEALAKLVDPYAFVAANPITLEWYDEDTTEFIIALTRLTETQKVQAALKVLGEK